MDAAVHVLCDAFADYPVMRFVIGPAGGAYARRLRAMVEFFTAVRFDTGVVFGAFPEPGQLAGVANVTLPAPRPMAPPTQALRETMWRELGEEARARYDELGRAWRPLGVEEPNYHLNMIGVRRSVKGRGIGRRLLDAVHELSDSDPISCGTTLTTEDPANVPLYQHFGYRITGHARISASVETWGFFRPRAAPS